ncbi:MAG: hypothetical protein HRU38_08750 [Saccharospirillaceae bacterium]|nr:hypothetical protein [Pseudomonadales bacterium]NRB78742.1 hypothetical protein [Saccharospirillaceae bacterium]
MNQLVIKKQQGMATLLLVIVVGILMSSVVLSTVYVNSTSQKMHITNHAQISSQVGAWKGIELYKIYLSNITSQQIDDSVGHTYIFTIQSDEYEINVIDFDKEQNVVAVISKFTDKAARSGSAVQAELKINQKPMSNPFDGQQVFLIGDLKATGRIEIDTDQVSKLLIDGDVTSQSINLLSLDEIRATGSVSFNSAEKLGFVFSNEDVTLTGGATVEVVQSLGNISASGGTAITTGLAHGYINYSTSGPSNSLSAKGDIILAGGGNTSKNNSQPLVGKAHSNSNIYITNKGSVGQVLASGDVEVKSNFATDTFITEGKITCPYYSKITITNTVMSNKSIEGSCKFAGTLDVKENQSNSISEVETLTKLTVAKPKVDVWKLREHANLQFLHNNLTGEINVNVKNMSGITDGLYFLKNLPNSSGANGAQELCFDDILQDCTGKIICDGYSAPCVKLNYKADKDESQWYVEGFQMASAVYFFDANVTLKLAYSNMGVLSAGDITSSNTLTLKAMNYSYFEELCENNFTSVYEVNHDSGRTNSYTPKTNSNVTGFYPTNYCDVQTRSIMTDVLGNTALLSGGVRDDVDPNNKEFTGGDISLNNLTVIFGSVLAGDNLKTSGLTLIHGFVVTLDNVDDREFNSAGQVTKRDENILSANLSIINDEYTPGTFKGHILPVLTCADDTSLESCQFDNHNGSGSESDENGPAITDIIILNARYL